MFKSLVNMVKGFFGAKPEVTVAPVIETSKVDAVMQAPYKIETPVVKQPLVEIVPELTVQPKKKAPAKKAQTTKPATKKRAPKKPKAQ